MRKLLMAAVIFLAPVAAQAASIHCEGPGGPINITTNFFMPLATVSVPGEPPFDGQLTSYNRVTHFEMPSAPPFILYDDSGMGMRQSYTGKTTRYKCTRYRPLEKAWR